MNINKIIITGDVLRPYSSTELGGQNNNINICYSLFAHQIFRATGIQPERLLHSPDGVDAHQYYRSEGIDDFMKGWIKLYDATHSLEELHDIYLPYFKNSLFICFELPPYLRSLLDSENVPYIDFRIHPVRFLEDILLAASSSNSEVQTILHSYNIHEDKAYIAANLCKAIATQMPLSITLTKNSLLVAGQCTQDATQIVNGQLFDITSEVPLINTICSAYHSVILKPHPFDQNFPLIQYLATKLTTHSQVKDNSYLLLANDCITGLLTVNSSLAYEATYFGKSIHQLSKKKYEVAYLNDTFDAQTYSSLENVFLETDFWRDILSPFFSVTKKDGIKMPFKPNRLRIVWNCFWDFNKIDTDIFISKAPPLTSSAPIKPKINLWKRAKDFFAID